MSAVGENLNEIRTEIANAARKAGRAPESVRLLAVSKTFPAEDVKSAYDAGQRMFGENRVQELEVKAPVLPQDIEWHLIGHLQSNKAAKAVEHASWIHSVDSVKLLSLIEKAAEKRNKTMNILLEVNISGEESKFGLRDDTEILEIAKAAQEMPYIRLRGLMTMAEIDADEKRLQGRGVSYCALCDGNFFRNAPVAVVGGGNAALEESLYLARLASKVYVIHRRDEFRGAKIYQDKLEAMPDKVELVRSSVVTALHGENALTGLSVRDLKTDEIRQIPVEGLFIYVGFEPATAYLPAALERDAQGFIVTDTEMRTSIPGIFAAGDVRSKLCRQVITAAGDGATAAQAAFVFLEQLHV